MKNLVLDSETLTAYAIEDQRQMSRAKNYFAWQARLIRDEIGQRVIEVGCGIGNFTEMLLDREAILALDIRPECIEHLKGEFCYQYNLQAIVCDAADEEFQELSRFCPDSCLCLNVLEHISDDLAALKNMRSVLQASGKVLLMLPAYPALFGPIDANLGHHRRYTRASIARLAADAGLQVKKISYMNMLGFFGWWANSRIFKKERQSQRQIEIFDRYIVPLLSRAEQTIEPPFGQSLFVVLQKS